MNKKETTAELIKRLRSYRSQGNDVPLWIEQAAAWRKAREANLLNKNKGEVK